MKSSDDSELELARKQLTTLINKSSENGTLLTPKVMNQIWHFNNKINQLIYHDNEKDEE